MWLVSFEWWEAKMKHIACCGIAPGGNDPQIAAAADAALPVPFHRWAHSPHHVSDTHM
jgi:hypothetical protein